MNAGAGSFFSGLLQGFAQTQERRRLQEQDKKEKDARVKLFEIQLEREQQQAKKDALQNAQLEKQASMRDAVLSKMQGQTIRPPLLNAGTRPPMSLTQLLADPESAMQLLQSGMIKGDDLLQQENNNATRQMIQGMTGGGQAPGGMTLTGIKMGPNGQMMPDFGLPPITTQTVDTPQGPRIQTFDPRSGKMVADLGAGKPESLTPEQGGRVSGLMQAQEIGKQVREKFFKPDGTIDRSLVFTSFGKLPGTQGRTVRNDMEIAVDAVNRARSGAALSKEDLASVVSQFIPSPLDSDEGISSKLHRFDQFVSGTLDLASLPPAVRKILDKGNKGGLPSGIPEGSTQIGTSGGKPVYQSPDGKRFIVK